MREVYNLYSDGRTVKITAFRPYIKTSDCAVIVFAGGGYACKCDYEGSGYAEFLIGFGITAFVVDYRVAPDRFPAELCDARRAVQFVRKNADLFGIDKQKIAVMGSSAGGHLAALVSTYQGDIEGEAKDETGREDYFPNAQILCYPVLSADESVWHAGSFHNLLGENFETLKESVSVEKLVSEKTPPAFIWHTFEDQTVNVKNSLIYAEALKDKGVPFELHVFPFGLHGANLATANENVYQWRELLHNWLKLIKFI